MPRRKDPVTVRILGYAVCPTLRAERDGIIQDLNRTRWSLTEAMDNAGLADHMGSADPAWLKVMRRECAELRREIRILTHEFVEPNRASSPSSSS